MNLPRIKKALISMTLALALSAVFVGCGNTATDSQIQDATNVVDDQTDSDIDASSDEEYVDPAQQKYRDEGITNNVLEFEVGEDNRFSGQHVNMDITGMEEFDKLEGEGYSDIPKTEGNVFVVFYMDLTNNDGTGIYITPEYCEIDVDGQPAEITFLVNDPLDGYETAFGNLIQTRNGYHYDKHGFMVIEAPKDWQNITFKYTGWRFDGLGNIIPIYHLNRDDLHRPEF